MRILNLKLENVSRFSQFSCNFKPGLNVIIGPNGSGKTTILDALYYGLYSVIKDRNLFINAKADSASITVTFDLNGTVYELEKSFSRNSNTRAELRLRQKYGIDVNPVENLIAYGTNQIKDWVADAIGSEDPSKWYLQQGAIHQFMSQVFVNDTLALSRLLGLGRLDSINGDFFATTTRSLPFDLGLHTTNKTHYAVAKSKLTDLYKEGQKILRELRKKGVAKSSQLLPVKLELQKRIAELDEKLQLVSVIEKLHSLQQIRNDLQTKLDAALSNSTALTSRHEQLCDKYTNLAKLLFGEDIYNLLLKLNFRHRSQQLYRIFSGISITDAEKREKSRQELSRQIETQKQNYFKLFRSRPPAVFKKLVQLESEARQLQEVIFRDSKLLSRNVSGVSYCPVCYQPLDNADFDKIAQRYQENQARYNELTEQVQQYRKLVSQRQDIKRECSRFFKSIRTAQQTLQNLKNSEQEDKNLLQYKDLFDSYEVDELNSIPVQLDTISGLITNYQNQLLNVDKSIQTLTSKYPNLTFDNVSFDTIKEERISLERRFTEICELESRLNDIRKRIDLCIQQIVALRPILNRELDTSNFYIRVKESVGGSFLVSACNTIKDYVINLVLGEVNKYCNQLELPFKVAVDDELRFVADTRYGIVPVTRLSYGQKIILSILTAFVLYLYSNSTGVLLADEPTAGLDSKNVNLLLSLFSVLNDLSVSRNVQCIFTTHEYNLYSGAPFNIIDLSSAQ